LLTLIFRRTTPESVTKGPVRRLRLDGDLLKDDEGTVLARRANRAWHVDGRDYLRLDCEGPVRIRMEKPGASPSVHGPFMHFSSADGISYAEHEVFASYDERMALWFSHRDRDYWMTLVLESAVSSGSGS
jgi:hypothetical protein